MIKQEPNELTLTGTMSIERLIELNGSLPKHELEREMLAARQANGRRERPSVYLSHSAEDEEILSHLVFTMRRACPTLYVDWSDPDLSPLSNDLTARVILGRIRSARKFIWLASPTAEHSSTRYWELGVAAGSKQLNETTIVSLVDRNEGQALQKYSLAHPRLVEDTRMGLPTGKLMVAFPDEMRIPLSVWLTS